MGIEERRAREREQRTADILRAAWCVAAEEGWVTFSLERVAAAAELGRATLYGYFDSLEALVLAMGEDALERLSSRVAEAPGLAEALDVPVRFAQSDEAAFTLLFPPARDPRSQFSGEGIATVQRRARELLGRLHKVVERSGASLPEDAHSAAAFVAAVSMAGAVIPELKTSTTLRHQWQAFCLGLEHDAARATGEPATKG